MTKSKGSIWPDKGTALLIALDTMGIIAFALAALHCVQFDKFPDLSVNAYQICAYNMTAPAISHLYFSLYNTAVALPGCPRRGRETTALFGSVVLLSSWIVTMVLWTNCEVLHGYEHAICPHIHIANDPDPFSGLWTNLSWPKYAIGWLATLTYSAHTIARVRSVMKASSAVDGAAASKDSGFGTSDVRQDLKPT